MKETFRSGLFLSWFWRSGFWAGPKALAPHRVGEGQVAATGAARGQIACTGSAAGQVAVAGTTAGEVTA